MLTRVILIVLVLNACVAIKPDTQNFLQSE